MALSRALHPPARAIALGFLVALASNSLASAEDPNSPSGASALGNEGRPPVTAASSTRFFAAHVFFIPALISCSWVSTSTSLRILTAVKKVWGPRVTTVFPRQGHYAHDPEILAAHPPADITIDSIGALLRFDLEALLLAGRAVTTAPPAPSNGEKP